MAALQTSRSLLAMHGGTPVRKTLLPYTRHSLDEDDVLSVLAVLRSDWLTTGPKVGEFEQSFASYAGARYGVSFSSGTAALHGAAFAAGLKAGDEAITTPLTFAATANCILYQGARPVFADVCPDSLNLDPKRAAQKITRQTRALIAVDYAGQPAELDAFMALAAEHGCVVIEDACHALGATYHGRRTGSVVHMSVFSFHPAKHITTAEGGMVTTDDAKLAGALRIFRNHGIASDAHERQRSATWYYEMVALGFNYRLSDVACALGLSQLKRLEANLARRCAIALRYTEAFREMGGLTLPGIRGDLSPAWHLYPIRLDLARLTTDRGQIFRALRAENIGVNVHYIPVHLHPYYRDRFGYKRGDYPIAEDAYERLISLPMFHGMSDQDVEDVVTAVGKVLSAFSK